MSMPRLPNPPVQYERYWADMYTKILEQENQTLWSAIQQLMLYELPSYSTADKLALTNVRIGRMIFDTDLDKACVYCSGGWETIDSAP